MIESVILHPGSPKTGTSGIQKCLAAHQDSLRAAGILYPETGRMTTDHVAPGQHALAMALTKCGSLDGEPVAGYVRNLRQEIEASSCSTLLLSSEEFFNTTAIAMLKEMLNAKTYTIYVSLRPQAELLNANYYTSVTYKRIVHRPAVFLPWAQQNVQYLEVLKALRGLSPDVTLHVERFEKGAPARNAPSQRFCEILELDIDASVADSHVEHPTLPAQPTLFLRMINELRADQKTFFRFFSMMHALKDKFSPEVFVMSPAHIGAVEAYFERENRAIRHEYCDGVDAALFAPVRRPDPERWMADVGDDTTKVELEIMSRLCAEALHPLR